jgi:aerobic carbon-monoxide dehydrogenase small subunit
MPKTLLQLQVNGVEKGVEAWPMQRLLDVLREELQLTGAKEGCGEGECGACSVLMDGKLVNSCLVPAYQARGARITTIEGLAANDVLHPVQQAFIETGGTQCGFCTPGMVLAVTNLLQQNPNPSETEIRTAIAGNLCRCTGYMGIVNAALQAARSAQEATLESAS